MLKKIIKAFLIIILLVLLMLGALLLYLSITEFKPEDNTSFIIDLSGTNTNLVSKNKEYKIMTFNIGYGALGKESDFFMDGGKEVYPRDRSIVDKNLLGISKLVKDINADFNLFQEIDINSKRSYYIDQRDFLEKDTISKNNYYASNFKVNYVPIPFPPLGKVVGGLLTSSNYMVENAERRSLTVPFSWPLRLINLKRCLLTTTLPIENSNSKLVLVNLHLEAYDDTGGRETQTKELLDFMKSEYEKGNYVIAGGDFNQSLYPIENLDFELDDDMWKPEVFNKSLLPDGFTLELDEMDKSTCRSLNKPYDDKLDNKAFYIIDGFIVSPNVGVKSVNVKDQNYEFSDHNPLVLTFELKN